MSDPSPLHYFVTGASGVVGSALIERLLREPNVRATILLRPKRGESVEDRLERLFQFWGIPASDTQRRGRIRSLAGDVSLPRFGLEEADYSQLTRELTHIVHSAAVVKMNLPLPEARAVAVGGAREIRDLAERAQKHHLQKIEFVSTVGVLGKRQKPLEEGWLHEPRMFHNSYEAAKAEAENVAEEAVHRGLPLTVWRPSMVVGDSHTGKIIHHQVFYYLCEFFSGARTFGVFPWFGATRLDLIPVDILVECMWRSSVTPSLAGRIMHACSGDRAVPLELLRARIEELYRRHERKTAHRLSIPPLAFGVGCKLAARFAHKKARASIETLPIFLAYLEEQRFGNEETSRWMASIGLEFPDPMSYVDRIVTTYLERKAR